MGGMKVRQNYKILAGLLFFPAIFMIHFKSAKELQYMPQTQEEHEHELGNKIDNTSDVSNEDTISINSLKRNHTENSVYLIYIFIFS